MEDSSSAAAGIPKRTRHKDITELVSRSMTQVRYARPG